ncbi:MAG: 2-oxoacid:acceptor oxidoreductase family protein [Candidatus Diapherotrites archaeon]
MKEIRLHARAGHGMVTGADIIAQAANYEGKFSQAFPFFGSEKRGPPVEAYVRIDDKPIQIHEEIAEPDIVVVADPSIMSEVDVCAGLKENGVVIVNTNKKPSELDIKAKNVFTVDASSVALKHFKKLILNTVMLGALCKVTGIVKIESVKRAIREVLGNKFPQQVVEANINAIQEVYDTMQVVNVGVKA